MMHSPSRQWVRGDVFVVGDHRWIVWAFDGSLAVAFPVKHHKMPRHRADVRIDDIGTLAAMGLPGGQFLIRVTSAARVVPAVKVGHAPHAVVADLAASVARELRHQAGERAHMRGHSEVAVRM